MRILAISFISVIALSPLASQVAPPMNSKRDIGETKAIAARALASLKSANEATAKAMGFESTKDVSNATLGEPLLVFMVELNDLRLYEPGSDPNKLVKPIDKVIYPVTVNEQVRSSIVVEKGKEGWAASSFGGTNFARLVTVVRDQSSKATNLSPGAYFVVQAPALNAYFVGYRQDNKLMLVSIVDDSTLNLKSGVPLPANQIFSQLQPVAKKHNGLPR